LQKGKEQLVANSKVASFFVYINLKLDTTSLNFAQSISPPWV